jgi:hypothetical protein
VFPGKQVTNDAGCATQKICDCEEICAGTACDSANAEHHKGNDRWADAN